MFLKMGESFIAEARREQIIQSCIDTLEEVGYTKVKSFFVCKFLSVGIE